MKHIISMFNKNGEEAFTGAEFSEIETGISFKTFPTEYFVSIRGKIYKTTAKEFRRLARIARRITKAIKMTRETGNPVYVPMN